MIAEESAPDPQRGEWWLVAAPFRHFRAHDVLPAAEYERVAHAFSAAMEQANSTGKVTKTARYDAEIVGLTSELASSFRPFFTDAWLEAMHRAMSIPDLGRIDAALHSSPSRSRSGWIHTDFCSAWFDESGPHRVGPMFPNRAACDYFTGKSKTTKARPAEYARAATMIYFLCNDGWQVGDGGETALYTSSRGAGQVLVPPLNNSLIYFRCTPHSYHRFVTNPRRTRNSIILWVHEGVEEALSDWGPGGLRRPS
jgi:hypothetical protein